LVKGNQQYGKANFFFKHFISQEDRSRVEIFFEDALKKNEQVCEIFFNLLIAEDGLIKNMSAQIIAKFACYSTDLINENYLTSYLNWIKVQLLSAVSLFKTNMKQLIYTHVCYYTFLTKVFQQGWDAV